MDNNTITGNESNNILSGEGGNDTLHGGRGDDFLDGGTGADIMYGSTGSDVYVVDDPGDQVIEAFAGRPQDPTGIDLVFSSIDYRLPDGIENLQLVHGSGPIKGSGNDLSNIITGNESDNVLSGAGGGDTIYGSGGNDTIRGGLGGDTLDGGAGNDTLTGGGVGGRGGHDTFYYSSPSEGGDTITDFTSGIDFLQFFATSFNFAAGAQLADGVKLR